MCLKNLKLLRFYCSLKHSRIHRKKRKEYLKTQTHAHILELKEKMNKLHKQMERKTSTVIDNWEVRTESCTEQCNGWCPWMVERQLMMMSERLTELNTINDHERTNERWESQWLLVLVREVMRMNEVIRVHQLNDNESVNSVWANTAQPWSLKCADGWIEALREVIVHLS